jgi:hypothetical protein
VKGFSVDEIAEAVISPGERANHVTAEAKDVGMGEILKWVDKCLKLSKTVYNTA